ANVEIVERGFSKCSGFCQFPRLRIQGELLGHRVDGVGIFEVVLVEFLGEVEVVGNGGDGWRDEVFEGGMLGVFVVDDCGCRDS
ncbi:hypothetical protein, partial [Kocuria salsicia]|uniref:hypothetical protein n=1 Tax=Kocuria salsicia TaxID=664639 RepID=UPI001C931998